MHPSYSCDKESENRTRVNEMHYIPYNALFVSAADISARLRLLPVANMSRCVPSCEGMSRLDTPGELLTLELLYLRTTKNFCRFYASYMYYHMHRSACMACFKSNYMRISSIRQSHLLYISLAVKMVASAKMFASHGASAFRWSAQLH